MDRAWHRFRFVALCFSSHRVLLEEVTRLDGDSTGAENGTVHGIWWDPEKRAKFSIRHVITEHGIT